jgi:methanogenic corrinoid protein MtbC1
VPTADLLQRVIAWKPDLVGLSISFPHQLDEAKNVLKQLQSSLGYARPATIVGGLAFNPFSELAAVLGADVFAHDSRVAVASAGQFLNQKGLANFD